MYAFPCGILDQQIKHDLEYSNATEEQMNCFIRFAVNFDNNEFRLTLIYV